jgi:hypothetical protein
VLSFAEGVSPLSMASHCLSSAGKADVKKFSLQLLPPSFVTATPTSARPSRSAKYAFPLSSVMMSESPPPKGAGFGLSPSGETMWKLVPPSVDFETKPWAVLKPQGAVSQMLPDWSM